MARLAAQLNSTAPLLPLGCVIYRLSTYRNSRIRNNDNKHEPRGQLQNPERSEKWWDGHGNSAAGYLRRCAGHSAFYIDIQPGTRIRIILLAVMLPPPRFPKISFSSFVLLALQWQGHLTNEWSWHALAGGQCSCYINRRQYDKWLFLR